MKTSNGKHTLTYLKIKQIYELQDKALRIINFKPKNHPVSELYKSNEILKH